MDTRRTTGGGAETAVLEDPSGRRALWMQRAGRVVFVVFLAWLIAIVLGGLGLAPVPGIPFAQVLRPSTGPPPLVRLPPPEQPAPADLLPALPDAALGPGSSPAAQPKQPKPAAPGRSGLAPGRTKTTGPATGRGRSGTAPGRTKTTPSVTTPRGRSSTAPGQTKTTQSGAPPATPPGQTRTSTSPQKP